MIEIPTITYYKEPSPELATLSLSDSEQKWAQEAKALGYIKSDNISASTIKERYQRFLTAVHELGHALVAKSLSWGVSMISTVPEGRVRGFTRTFPKRFGDPVSRFRERTAIALGSMAIQEKYGINPHKGTGSDEPAARVYSKYLNILTGGSDSESGFFRRGLSLAKSCLGGLTNTEITRQAMKLEFQGVQ
jgi:hypothetical protein